MSGAIEIGTSAEVGLSPMNRQSSHYTHHGKAGRGRSDSSRSEQIASRRVFIQLLNRAFYDHVFLVLVSLLSWGSLT